MSIMASKYNHLLSVRQCFDLFALLQPLLDHGEYEDDVNELETTENMTNCVNQPLEDIKDKIRKSSDDLNRYFEGKTLLHTCCEVGRHDIVELLCQFGAAVNLRDTRDGFTALHISVIKNHVDCVKALLRFNADCSILSSLTSRSALHYACQLGHTRCAEEMLCRRNDPRVAAILNHLDAFDRTPLQMACIEGCLGCVQSLLRVGCDATLLDVDGRSPDQLAESVGNNEIAEALKVFRGSDVAAAAPERWVVLGRDEKFCCDVLGKVIVCSSREDATKWSHKCRDMAISREAVVAMCAPQPARNGTKIVSKLKSFVSANRRKDIKKPSVPIESFKIAMIAAEKWTAFALNQDFRFATTSDITWVPRS